MRAEPFHYKIGEVETVVPWFPPDPECLNDWRDDFFLTPGVEHYTFWLCGAAMEGRQTDDIDIIVTGDIRDYAELEMILVSAVRLGFKHRQLIDIGWNQYYEKYLLKGKCERRAICCEHFYEHGWCTLKECMAVARSVETIVIGNEIYKNGRMITPPYKHAVRLGPSLWKVRFRSPSEKQIKRMQQGVIYTQAPVIITPDLDFKDVVPWP